MGGLFSRRREEQPERPALAQQKPKRKKKEDVVPPPALTDSPWRKIKGWGEKERDELKNDIARRSPKTNVQHIVPALNIALTGQIGAGKSSYLNSINNIFQKEVAGARADVGKMATSLTTKYRVYAITPKDEAEPLCWRICDTMGLQAHKENDAVNILKAVNGHVPDEFEFSEEEINEDTHDYIAHPRLGDKAHSVAIVVNGVELEQMDEDVKEKLKMLRKQLGANRTYILLTHIDQACEEVNKDVTKVFHSTAIRNLVQKVGTVLHGLPENQIFPIVNYKEQVELDDAMDILLLYPLRQMLSSAQTYLSEESKPEQIGPTSLSHRGQPVMHPFTD